jgi:creatinine amidohydrolase
MTEHRGESAMILPTATTTDHDTVHAAVAVLPVGSFEQHGPYLPLVTDTLIATAIGDAISRNYTVFQLPAITYGCSHEHSDFPGTVSISATTLAAVVGDVCRSLRQQDIHALVVVNGHGGNYVLASIAQEANTSNAIRVGLYPSRDDWTEARHAAGMISNNHDDMHAGELETSILLAAHPSYVREGWQASDHTASDRRYLTTLGISAYTTSGVIGYPSRANADKGYLVLSHLGRAAGRLITLLTDRQI